jgi:hypothetical protein
MAQEPTPYYQAARFPHKTAAGKAYDPLQAVIFEEECDLSVYRFFRQRERKWYVVVIGEKPPSQLHQRLETILFTLTRGERVTLDNETVVALLSRRAQQVQLGPWVERHYQPPEEE